jgi:hypothetical protein
MRFIFGEGSPVSNSTTKVYGCNGTLYCTTSDGVVAFDFHRDKIFKYKSSTILVADEPIALRNAGATFRTFAANIGTIPDNNIHDVSCKTIGSVDYLAFTNDSGVTVMQTLASGVATSADGPLPGARVDISDKGALYWVGYDPIENKGELSCFSNIAILAGPGDTAFNRTTFYGVDSPLSIFGSNITSFSIQTLASTDIIAVGTTQGITFLATSPATPYTKAVSYGVSSPAENPISDPAFENYLGLDWRLFTEAGFHEDFVVRRSDIFSTSGDYSLLLRLGNIDINAFYEEGTTVGIYQDVDFTGVESIYFDIRLEGSPNVNLWDFEIIIDDTVVKAYSDTEGAFTKSNDSASVLGFDGVHRLKLQIRVVNAGNPTGISTRRVYIDNFRTKVGEPDFRILPPGNAAISEVLLQYDVGGHKVYFSTSGGYGALDLDDNSLDYFIPLSTFGPKDTETLSADFSRVDNEV